MGCHGGSTVVIENLGWMWHNLVSEFVAHAYYQSFEGICGQGLGPQPVSWGFQEQGKCPDALSWAQAVPWWAVMVAFHLILALATCFLSWRVENVPLSLKNLQSAREPCSHFCVTVQYQT